MVDKYVCERWWLTKMVDKVVHGKVEEGVCNIVWWTKMCVSEEGRAEEEAEEEPGIENQKQEPHTKLWRKTRTPHKVVGNKTKNKTTKTQKKKTRKTKWQDPTLCHYYPPLRCAILFFLFFGFLVSCFLVQVAPWRAKDLDLALCQFSHFRGCRLAFGWFYYLLWACGSISNHCKKLW